MAAAPCTSAIAWTSYRKSEMKIVASVATKSTPADPLNPVR
jgi:hypothetical protein